MEDERTGRVDGKHEGMEMRRRRRRRRRRKERRKVATDVSRQGQPTTRKEGRSVDLSRDFPT
jgi:hypothetical protein